MDQRIQFIISTIEKDPATRLNSNDLALPINLSSSRLRHLFKAETGQTVGQYRKDARLEKARVLLRTTLLSVKEIMHHVGISSNSHFARDFKEECGLSPTQYRARSQESPSIW